MKKLVLLWLNIFNKKDRTLYDLKGFLKDIDLWIIAYNKLLQNKGGKTPGPDGEKINGITLNTLINLKNLVNKGQYKWKGSKRTKILKSNKKEIRFLSIPATSDKIVQEVLRLILEPIFELSFSEHSHGFRKGRNCHSALGQIDRDFKSIKWILNADLKSYFDTINHDKLMSLLEERIKDPLILKLIRTGLQAKIFKFDKMSYIPELGIPQGSLLSPLLSNIYLNSFDKFIESKIESYNKGIKPKHNKDYEKARYRKTSIKGLISYDPFDSSYRRMTYVRYADNFIIGIRGPIKDCIILKEEIKTFLNNELYIALNSEKTKIIHIKDEVQFLGHRIIRQSIRVFTKFKTVKRIVYRKSKHQIFGLDGIYSKVFKKFKTLGLVSFMKKNNKLIPVGKSYSPFLPYQQSEIIQKYNSILRGLCEWWKFAGNRRNAIHYIAYLLRYSAAKTLAQKYGITMKKIFTLAGKDLSIPIKNIKAIGVTDQKIIEWQKSVNKETLTDITIAPILYTTYSQIPSTENLKYGKTWKPEYLKKLENLSEKLSNSTQNKFELELLNTHPKEFNFLKVLTRGLSRGIKLLNSACILCQSKENIQIHHLKSVSSIKGKSIKEIRIKSFSSKQIPLCAKCHLSVHKNDWRNKPINPKAKL